MKYIKSFDEFIYEGKEAGFWEDHPEQAQVFSDFFGGDGSKTNPWNIIPSNKIKKKIENYIKMTFISSKVKGYNLEWTEPRPVATGYGADANWSMFTELILTLQNGNTINFDYSYNLYNKNIIDNFTNFNSRNVYSNEQTQYVGNKAYKNDNIRIDPDDNSSKITTLWSKFVDTDNLRIFIDFLNANTTDERLEIIKTNYQIFKKGATRYLKSKGI